MAVLPKPTVSARPSWQRERLCRWLREWSLWESLRSERADAAASPTASLAALPTEHELASAGPLREHLRPYDEAMAVGQIRLLSADCVPGVDEVVLVYVLSDWDAGDVLIAKLSPFAEPATPGEWLTGFSEPLVRVISLWNAVNVPPDVVRRSWVAAELSAERQADAWAVFRHIAVGLDLPSHLVEQVGPPIVHPGDPRIVYQREQSAVMLALQDAAAERGDRLDRQAIGEAVRRLRLVQAPAAAAAFPEWPGRTAVRGAMPLAAGTPEQPLCEVIVWCPASTAADLAPGGAGPRLFARLLDDIQLTAEGPYASWQLEGDLRLLAGAARFLLIEAESGDCVGEGTLVEGGTQAILTAGDWSRLKPHIHDIAGLAVVPVVPSEAAL